MHLVVSVEVKKNILYASPRVHDDLVTSSNFFDIKWNKHCIVALIVETSLLLNVDGLDWIRRH